MTENKPADRDWNSPIGAEKTLARVSTDAIERRETVEKRIRVSNVRQVPDNKLAKSDDEHGLYYVRKVNHVPDKWKRFADRTPQVLKENGYDVVETLEQTFREQIWPDDLSKAPRTWDGDDDVTGELREWIPEVIKEMDPLHGDYSGVPTLAAMNVQREIEDSLTQPQGWSIRSVANRLTEEFDWMGDGQAKNIARMEVSAVLNTAKSVMYRAAEPVEDTWTFDWVGPDDEHTTDICREVKEELERRGGEVPYEVLEDILREKAQKYEDRGGTPHRVGELIPHFGCRRTVELASR